MKKISVLLLVSALLFALCGCGEKNPPTPPIAGDETINGSITVTLNVPDEGTFSSSATVSGYTMKSSEKSVVLAKNADALTYFKAEYLADKDADTLSPAFLDNTVKEFKNLEFPGTMEIGGEEARFAEEVIGYDDTQYAEAYIINTHSGALALTVSVSAAAKDRELPVLRSFCTSFTLK